MAEKLPQREPGKALKEAREREEGQR
ncbi:hypothetical protein SEA_FRANKENWEENIE_281 [Streptomyces phage Frankenweenie]|nr:hypothetical protein SEA_FRANKENWEENIE_281 [Streptomyces phage Frankenweenie]